MAVYRFALFIGRVDTRSRLVPAPAVGGKKALVLGLLVGSRQDWNFKFGNLVLILHIEPYLGQGFGQFGVARHETIEAVVRIASASGSAEAGVALADVFKKAKLGQTGGFCGLPWIFALFSQESPFIVVALFHSSEGVLLYAVVHVYNI